MAGVASPVGERIRLRRQALGLTQDQFAGRVGVSPSAVLGWEKGRYFPKRHQGAVEHVLGISLLAEDDREPELPTDPRERELWDLAVQDMPPAQAWEVIEEYRRRRRRPA
jgi:transcriptional regulator with XRE-family HTH domain